MICDWNAPSADRYTGTVAAAIAAYGMPIATQSALIAAFERREFTDSVVIDRDSIRGATYEYEPTIQAMHFGSRGRICNVVTRAGWTERHVETALVICADGECIGWPAVCGNVFRLARRPGADRPDGSAVVFVGDKPPLVLTVEPVPAVTVTADTSAPRVVSYGAAAAFIPHGFAGLPLPYSVPAVPEPATWALMLAGLVMVGLRRAAR